MTEAQPVGFFHSGTVLSLAIRLLCFYLRWRDPSMAQRCLEKVLSQAVWPGSSVEERATTMQDGVGTKPRWTCNR